jgi:membrane-associated phospholipid phosphatase
MRPRLRFAALHAAMHGTTETARYFDAEEGAHRGLSHAREVSLRVAIRELALQDWVLLTYQAALVLLVLSGERGPVYRAALHEMTGLLGAALAAILLIRSGWLARNVLYGNFMEAVAYGLCAMGVIEGSYFFFRSTLPQINPSSFDSKLYEFDLKVFGFEPALAIEPFVSGPLTEWFSFVYVGYFLLITAFVLPILFFPRARHVVSEFGLSMICIFAVGHLTYTVVPGFGPLRALAHLFDAPLPAGFWHDIQLAVVEEGGAQKDIFPSIHTAVPLFLTGYAYGQRRFRPFNWGWPIVCFFALNIILATMYLRWHYLVDVVAGVFYGCIGLLLQRVGAWESARRKNLGLRPAWPSFFPDADQPLHK